jgi:hypothetical protein
MNKPLELREADFRREIEKYTYPKSMKEEFFQYWTEPNKSNSKMKYEMEKTWHLGRRLARWANNPFGKKDAAVPAPKEQVSKPITPIDHLDAFVRAYRARPSEMPFDKFGQWFDFMKDQNLLYPYTREKANDLMDTYKGDKEKCKCAIVQITLDGYINTNLLPSDLVNSRVGQKA